MRLLFLYRGLVVGLLSLAPMQGSTAILLAEIRSGYDTLPSEEAALHEQKKASLVVSALYREEGHGTLPLALATLVAKYATGGDGKAPPRDGLCHQLTERHTYIRCGCFCYWVCLLVGVVSFIFYLCLLPSTEPNHHCLGAYREGTD